MSTRTRTHRIAPLVLALLVALGLPGVSPAAAMGGGDQSNHCVPDVIDEIQNVMKVHGDAMGYTWSSEAHPDLGGTHHLQGIQRTAHATPLLVSGYSSEPDFLLCPPPDYYCRPAGLVVVEMQTRTDFDTPGERMRSNRRAHNLDTDDTPPSVLDRVVQVFDYSDYTHPGGLQMVGNILAVPLEGSLYTSDPDAKVIFYDFANPAAPIRLAYELDIYGHKAGAVGLIRESDGRFLLAVGAYDPDPGATFPVYRGGSEITFYRSNVDDLRDLGLQFTPFKIWDHEELLPTTSGWPVEDCCSLSTHQTLNFVRQCDGTLYMVATRNTNKANLGEDRTWLYRVDVSANDVVITEIIPNGVRRDCSPDGSGRLCEFMAATGTYVTPSGELILYASEHYVDGPKHPGDTGIDDEHDTVRMAEFRSRNVNRADSPLLRPTADAGGPYTVDEGSTRSLVSSGTEPAAAEAWVEMYEDESYDDQAVMLDWADRFDDDFDDLSRNDNFDDEADSLRMRLPLGCYVTFYESAGYAGKALALPGTGRLETIAVLDDYVLSDGQGGTTGAGDQIDSVRLDGACEGDLFTTQWSSPADPMVGTLDALAGQFHGVEGPGTATVQLTASGAYTDSNGNLLTDTATTQVQVLNVAPDVSIDSVRDEAGMEIGVDVPAVLVGTLATLTGSFTDPGVLDTHGAAIDWGDATVDSQSAFGQFDDCTGGGVGTAEHGHAFVDEGTFTVTLDVTDDDGGQSADTSAVDVIDAADAVQIVADEVGVLLQQSGLDPMARAALESAMDWLVGHAGGRAHDGALDGLVGGQFKVALQRLVHVLEQLEAAEASDPGLDLTAEKSLLTLAAKSIVQVAIAEAIDSATSANDLDRLAVAVQDVAIGDAALAATDYIGSATAYADGFQLLQGETNPQEGLDVERVVTMPHSVLPDAGRDKTSGGSR